MDLSISHVAQKMILAIGLVSAVIATVGAILYPYPVAFVVGVAMAFVINAAKVLLLKRAIVRLTTMDDVAKAKIYFQGQFFLRMVLTAGGLLVAVFLPDHVASLIGAAAGLFAYQIAMYIIRLFIPEAAITEPSTESSTTQEGE